MAGVVLRPDLRTAGGEVSDILYNGRYAGTLVLVYREQDRISGSVQLEQESLSPKDKDIVNRFVTEYIQEMIEALKAKQCDVLVTYSSYDHVIATDSVLDYDEMESLYEDEPEIIWVTDEEDLGDWDIPERETLRMRESGHDYDDDLEEEDSHYRSPAYYELVSTKETKHKVEYHVYDKDQEWIAEVFMRIIGNDIIGDVHWMFSPDDEEVEVVTNLIVTDFDDDTVDTFTLDHRYEGVIIETIELTHQDLLEQDEPTVIQGTPDELEEYTVVLARDDQDMLTYEIYNQTEGGLPIGTATVDISRRQLTGFIDFRTNVSQSGVREKVASLVMQELDKEKDYRTISFTMLQQNKPIEEVVFQNEPVH
jgi:hypothetical protein